MPKSEELKTKYKEISEFVHSYCCKMGCLPHDRKMIGLCCNEIACNITESETKERLGITLVREGKTFLKNNRCCVEPHLRPICSVHACNRLQIFAGVDFMDKYMKLREEISRLEYRENPEW